MTHIATITASGRLVSLEQPDPGSICWRDVATSLSRINRFTGATLAPYTVAQHSMFVADLVGSILLFSPRGGTPGLAGQAFGPLAAAARRDDRLAQSVQLAALLHDAHEAYVGDVSTPVSRLLARLSGDDYLGQIKRQIDAAIYAAAGLSWPAPPAWQDLIAAADAVALSTETRDLLPDTPGTRAMLQAAPAPAPYHIRPLSATAAEERFLKKLNTLIGAD